MSTKPAPHPDQLRDALKSAFPDAEVSRELVSAASDAVKSGTVVSSKEASNMPSPPATFAETDEAICYYSARATHARSGGTTSIFEGILPQVRVLLPATGGTAPIQTEMGVVIQNDRKIRSAAQVKALVGRAAARVELITAPRAPDASGGRFGAIALYLCYTNLRDKAPSFYILEAGTATGQPKVLFYGAGMGQSIADKHTGYQPTPFSSPKNYYNGLLVMQSDNPNEPGTLIIQGRASLEAPPYIQVTIQYARSREPPVYKPLDLILEAAARVGTVGDAMGASTDASIAVATAFLGDSLDWIVKPGE